MVLFPQNSETAHTHNRSMRAMVPGVFTPLVDFASAFKGSQVADKRVRRVRHTHSWCGHAQHVTSEITAPHGISLWRQPTSYR